MTYDQNLNISLTPWVYISSFNRDNQRWETNGLTIPYANHSIGIFTYKTWYLLEYMLIFKLYGSHVGNRIPTTVLGLKQLSSSPQKESNE